MRIAPVADIKARFSNYLRETLEGPVVVTKNGKPVAVIIAVRDEDEVERLLMAHSPKLRSILDRSWQSIQEGRGIKAEDFWKEMAGDG